MYKGSRLEGVARRSEVTPAMKETRVMRESNVEFVTVWGFVV